MSLFPQMCGVKARISPDVPGRNAGIYSIIIALTANEELKGGADHDAGRT